MAVIWESSERHKKTEKPRRIPPEAIRPVPFKVRANTSKLANTGVYVARLTVGHCHGLLLRLEKNDREKSSKPIT